MKQFFKKWKQGIMTLKVSSQLKAKRNGQIGTIVGVIFAAVALALRGQWQLLLFFAFFVFLMVVDMIGTIQQLEQVKKIEKSLYGGGE